MSIPLDALANASRLEEMQSAMGLFKEWQELAYRQPLLENPASFQHEKEKIAALLVDSHLGKIARKVRVLGENDKLDSPEFLNEWAELAFYSLLWTRFDQLSDGLKLNLLYQSGPNITKKHLAGEIPRTDHFVVAGIELDREEQLTRRSVYLYGIHSQRYFFILDYAFNQQPFDMTYIIGRFYKGEFVVYPFPGALRISIVSMRSDLPLAGALEQIPVLSLPQATGEFYANLKLNPFGIRMPALLLLRSDFVRDRWRVLDSHDHLVRIAPQDDKIQSVFYAACFQRPVRIIGLLSRNGIRPMSYYNGEVLMGFGDLS